MEIGNKGGGEIGKEIEEGKILIEVGESSEFLKSRNQKRKEKRKLAVMNKKENGVMGVVASKEGVLDK